MYPLTHSMYTAIYQLKQRLNTRTCGAYGVYSFLGRFGRSRRGRRPCRERPKRRQERVFSGAFWGSPARSQTLLGNPKMTTENMAQRPALCERMLNSAQRPRCTPKPHSSPVSTQKTYARHTLPAHKESAQRALKQPPSITPTSAHISTPAASQLHSNQPSSNHASEGIPCLSTPDVLGQQASKARQAQGKPCVVKGGA